MQNQKERQRDMGRVRGREWEKYDINDCMHIWMAMKNRPLIIAPWLLLTRGHVVGYNAHSTHICNYIKSIIIESDHTARIKALLLLHADPCKKKLTKVHNSQPEFPCQSIGLTGVLIWLSSLAKFPAPQFVVLLNNGTHHADNWLVLRSSSNKSITINTNSGPIFVPHIIMCP